MWKLFQAPLESRSHRHETAQEESKSLYIQLTSHIDVQGDHGKCDLEKPFACAQQHIYGFIRQQSRSSETPTGSLYIRECNLVAFIPKKQQDKD